MSDENTRNQRSKRFKNDRRTINKQLKIAKVFNVEVKEDDQHRLAKLKVLNCGDPDCWLCANPRKINKGKNINALTYQERRHLDTAIWEDD